MSRAATSAVVFSFAYETWADARSRQMSWSADRMVERLLADETIPSVLVSDPLRSHLGRLDVKRRRLLDAGFPERAGRVLVHPRRWRRKDHPHRAPAAAAYRRLDRWLWLEASRRNLEGVLVTCHPVHAAVADRGRWTDVVYYGWDDWLNYPPFEPARDLMAWSYRQMAENDVAVIGVSETLVERIGARRSTVVPNAISILDYRDLPAPPSWFTRIQGPIALYAGSLERRIDVRGLEAAARQLPGWTFVLVGYLAEPHLFDELVALPNVVFSHLVPRPQVLAMMAAADVGLVPHLETPMTVTMSPLKLYEYLAAGTPVVASDLPPMRGISERCLLVPPGSDLTSAILQAAGLPRVQGPELESWRRAHDWDVRYASWRAAIGLPVDEGTIELDQPVADGSPGQLRG